MTNHSLAVSAESYRRFGTTQRALTLAPVVPSQDVTRYQAHNMPPPTYDLAQTNERPSRLTILLRTLALVAVGAAIILVRRFATLLQS
jgi:hypothetical protein